MRRPGQASAWACFLVCSFRAAWASICDPAAWPVGVGADTPLGDSLHPAVRRHGLSNPRDLCGQLGGDAPSPHLFTAGNGSRESVFSYEAVTDEGFVTQVRYHATTHPDLVLLDYVPHLERLECRAHQLRLVLNDSAVVREWRQGSPLVAGPRWGCRVRPDPALFEEDPRRGAHPGPAVGSDSDSDRDDGDSDEVVSHGHVYRRLVRTWVLSPTKVVLDTLPMEWWESFEDAVISVRAFSPDRAVARHHEAGDKAVEEFRRRHRASASKLLPHLDAEHALRGHTEPVHHRYMPRQEAARVRRAGPTRRRALAVRDDDGAAQEAEPWEFESLGDATGILHRAKLPRSADKEWLMVDQLEEELSDAEREDRRRLAQRMSARIEEMSDRLAAAGGMGPGSTSGGEERARPGEHVEPHAEAGDGGRDVEGGGGRGSEDSGAWDEGEGEGGGRLWHQWRPLGASEEQLRREALDSEAGLKGYGASHQRLRFRSQRRAASEASSWLEDDKIKEEKGDKTVMGGWNVEKQTELEVEDPAVKQDAFHYFKFSGEAKPTDPDHTVALCEGDLTLWDKEQKHIKKTIPVPPWLGKALGTSMTYDADFRCEKCFAVMGAEFDMTVVTKGSKLQSLTAGLTEGIGINFHNVIETKLGLNLKPALKLSSKWNTLGKTIPFDVGPLTFGIAFQVRFQFTINMQFALDGKVGFGFKTSATRTRTVELKREDGFTFNMLDLNDSVPEFKPIYEPPEVEVEMGVELIPSIDLRLLLLLEQIPLTHYALIDLIPMVKFNVKIGLEAKSQTEKTGDNCVKKEKELWIQVKPTLSITAQLGFMVKVLNIEVASFGAADDEAESSAVKGSQKPEPSDYSSQLPTDNDDMGYTKKPDDDITLYDGSTGFTRLLKKALEDVDSSGKFDPDQSSDEALCFGSFKTDTEHHECMNDNGILTHCADSNPPSEEAMTAARFCKVLQCRDVASATSGHEFLQRCSALYGRNCVKQCDDLASLYGPEPGASSEASGGILQAEYTLEFSDCVACVEDAKCDEADQGQAPSAEEPSSCPKCDCEIELPFEQPNDLTLKEIESVKPDSDPEVMRIWHNDEPLAISFLETQVSTQEGRQQLWDQRALGQAEPEAAASDVGLTPLVGQ